MSKPPTHLKAVAPKDIEIYGQLVILQTRDMQMNGQTNSQIDKTIKCSDEVQY